MKASKVVFLVFLSTLSLCVANTQPVKAAENSWVSKAPMHQARAGLGVAVVNGRIYAIGGITNPPAWYKCTNTSEEYDLTSDSWTFKAPMPTPRASFGIAVYQNKIYCIGGTIGVNNNKYVLSGVNEVYDPATNTWESKASMLTPRMGVTANVVDGKIYLIGGGSNATEVYDPETNSWTRKASMPVKPGNCASAVVDDKIHVMDLAFHQIYDPKNDKWSTGTPNWVWGAAAGATTGVNAPKRIYVLGVNDLFWLNTSPGVNQVYNPEDNSWTSGPAMPSGRFNTGVAVINDTLYAIGGEAVSIGDVTVASAKNEQYTPFLFGTVPAVSIYSPKNVTYTSADVALNFWVNRSTSWMGYSLDGRENITVSGDTHNLSLSGLSEGTHRLTVYAINVAGDVTSSSTVYFTVDMSPPRVAVLSPENKTYGPSNVQLAFTVNEKVSWTGYSLDSQANITISGNTTLPELSYGLHNLAVYATDMVDHTGASETIYFTVAQPSEPFPTWIVAATAIIAIGAAAVLVYFRKIKKTNVKAEKVMLEGVT